MVKRRNAVTQESIDQGSKWWKRMSRDWRKQKANEGMHMAPYLRAMKNSQALNTPLKDP
jgi:hypothetical protein